MNNRPLPVKSPPAPAGLTGRSVKRRIDPIDAPARPLGAKRSALFAKRTDAATWPIVRPTAPVTAGDTLLSSGDGSAFFLLRATTFGLLIERTQGQVSGTRLVQTMVFYDQKSFDHWCTVEPMRFEDGLLFSKLVRSGHEAFADKR